MNRRVLAERSGLVPWIVGTAAGSAIGLGCFRWSVAFSQTDGVPARQPVVLQAVGLVLVPLLALAVVVELYDAAGST